MSGKLFFFSALAILSSSLAGGHIFASSDVEYTAGQHYLFKIFKERRSVRKFQSTPVPQEHILKILDMARCAPTAGNQQPWKFFVIRDMDKVALLKQKCIQYGMFEARLQGIKDQEALDARLKRLTERYDGYLSAPVYVVVLVDKNSRYPQYNTYDGALAGGYLMLAARALGYGTVFSQGNMHYGFVKEIFKIPDNYEQICFTPIGVPDPWPESPPKKPLNEFVVFDEFIENVNYRLPKKRRAITLEPAVIESYAGAYELAADFVITVTTDKGRIYARITGHPVIEIFPQSETEFFFEFKKEETLIRFVKDERGTVTGLVIVLKGMDNLAKRVL